MHEGPTLGPFCAPIAFAIQRRTVEIRAAEDLALGGREMERGQQGRCGGERLDVRNMTQHHIITQVVESQVGADELAWGPGVERVRVGAEKGFEGLGRSVFGDDERKRTGDDGGVVVERRSEHRYPKRRCQCTSKGSRHAGKRAMP